MTVEVMEQEVAGTEAPAHKSIQITPEQQAAIEAVLQFLADPDPVSNFFVLEGFAGTGKTFCMREVVARTSKSRANYAFTAPTNKAAKELKKVTGEACTIFSLLGLRIDKSGEVKQLTTGKTPVDLSELDAIFVDEGGMVNKNLMGILKTQSEAKQVKVIFMGDRAQLPPVGETKSPIWDLENGARLNKVMRHDNEILELVTTIREVMWSPAPSIILRSNNSNGEGVWKMSKRDFKEGIYQSAINGKFADGEESKVIAWRNATVAGYNDLIRAGIFGANAVPGFYLNGDRIVAAAPCSRGEEVLLHTDAEALVESALDCQHPMEPKYKGIELKCRTEDNRVIRLLALHPESAQQFNNDSQELAHMAKATPRLWKKFWEHKELFHDIKYAYALTTHRSQGSTYENVWVDFQDILVNRNRLEAFQCLYVACSRPRKRLYLA